MKRLALFCPAYHQWPDLLNDYIRNGGCRYTWAGCTYSLSVEKQNQLNDLIEKRNFFNLYIHSVETPSVERKDKGAKEGTKRVHRKLKIIDYVYNKIPNNSPEKKCTISGIDNERGQKLRFWGKTIEIMKTDYYWKELIDYNSEDNLSKWHWNLPHWEFGYIIDPED